ncbi:hypothetical protein ACJMK2_007672 [Sinanodonta woodiana]|uniref:Uncharacterized protein n=1 Tax=Sinanodonta woodiana TaxID=1069815 RepID=A0ABD3VJ84_SINWO
MFLFAFCLLTCFPKAATDAETVWLRDVTTRLQTDEREDTGSNLPDQLSFHLKSNTHDIALNLKRNYQIDPNTNIYVVQKFEDGQPLLEKTQNSENEDVAYYQDMNNGAFMTARCVKRSTGQCDIIIHGEIQLGDRSYNLRPSEENVIPNDSLEMMGLRGKRYILQDQTNIQTGMSVENNELTNIKENNLLEKYIYGLQDSPYGQDKQNRYMKPEGMSSS